ncbi:MAG: hypothetical protein ICV51_12425 [Flavisolibacter sp.]|nr:hypothetical protein [Flavisolibacter sp.]MBD0376423.1 hypothetical protein [Flavisolibacter sp.]
MACSFSIPFTGTPEAVLDRARSAVQNQGGIFTGDVAAGNFQVSALGTTVKGRYTVAGQNLNITIDDKPFFLPCGTIEGFLRSQLGA